MGWILTWCGRVWAVPPKVSVTRPNLVEDPTEKKKNLEKVHGIRPKFGPGIGNIQLLVLKKVNFSRKIAFFGTQISYLYAQVRKESQ